MDSPEKFAGYLIFPIEYSRYFITSVRHFSNDDKWEIIISHFIVFPDITDSNISILVAIGIFENSSFRKMTSKEADIARRKGIVILELEATSAILSRFLREIEKGKLKSRN